MGYTTEFSGRFVANKKFTKALSNQLNKLAETRHGGNCDVHPGFPGFWCQWVPSADGCGIEWDGGEKFYAYDRWLQLIIDRYLKPAGVELSGRVLYRGEDADDIGYIVAEGGTVRVERLDMKASITR